MKKLFLLILSFFLLSSAFAKNEHLFNLCNNEKISFDNFLSNKSVLLNKEVDLNEGKVFLISYLDNDGEICLQKKYDLLFKLKDGYVYNEKLFDNLTDVYPEIYSKNGLLIVGLEYGNGQANIENYYFSLSSSNVFLENKRILYSRGGKSREVKYNKVDLSDVFFSDLINSSENSITCSLNSSGDHSCNVLYDNKIKKIEVSNSTCPAFDMKLNKDVIEVFCSPPKDYSNYIYYKYVNGDFLFFKYESSFGGNDNLVNELSYELDDPYLLTLKKDLYTDIHMRSIPRLGFIKDKTFLFDKNGKRSQMYLIKNDKVLVLSNKKDDQGKEWLRVFFQGKKNIDMWIKADSVYLN